MSPENKARNTFKLHLMDFFAVLQQPKIKQQNQQISRVTWVWGKPYFLVNQAFFYQVACLQGSARFPSNIWARGSTGRAWVGSCPP